MNRLHPLVLAVAAAATVGVRADDLLLTADRDNTLYEHPAGSLSNGGGERLFTGRTGQSGPNRRRALVHFDLSAIPSGATITGVQLTLRMSRTQAGPHATTVHRLLADWGEGASNAESQEGQGAPAAPGDATWLHTFHPGSFWAAPGGDFVAAPSASVVVSGTGDYTWTGAALVADVQSWVGGSANFGWIVLGDESASGTAKRFDAREIAQATRRPRLLVSFEPPAEVGACCIADGTCVLLDSDACAGAAGTFQGPGTGCAPNPCPAPIGACCFDDGTCAEIAADLCTAAAGTFQGAGTDCSPNPCPPPFGACCLSGGDCADLDPLACAALDGIYQGHGTACAGVDCPFFLVPYVDPLPLPAVAQPVSGAPGDVASYEIAMTEFDQQLHRDLAPTRVWGFGGSYPGPTIEARRDHPVTVTWINDLRDENGVLRTNHYLPVDTCMHGPDELGPTPRTVVHLHGGHVPMAFDGYPEWTILPGESVVYEYPNIQPAATIWYHDHALGITRLNVIMGLAGFYLVRDDAEDALDLPDGEFEVPLAIQDRSFNPDGTLSYPADWQDHFFGEFVLVNGKVWPYFDVRKAKYRFRILNGSTSRTYRLALSNGAPFTQIGSDGGLLAAPIVRPDLLLTPGERADVIVDFSAAATGEEILLVNDAPAPYPSGGGLLVPEVMKFVVGSEGGATPTVPDELAAIAPIPEEEAVESRTFELRKFTDPCAGSIWLINGMHWDHVTERPELGTTEIWAFANRSGTTHPMHMHLVFFQVLDRQPFEIVNDEIVPIGEPVPAAPWERGWKDTVSVQPFEIVRVIARFEDFTGRFAYHCHILEHEDHEMMRQFEVVLPCPEDLDGSGTVDFADLLAVLAAWGTCPPPPPACAADLDDSGAVDFADLLSVLAAWGPCP